MKVNACMYLRLSKEDENINESNSISNQRGLIKSYADNNGITIVKEYVDDGYSGTNFERPKFKEMIKELELGDFKTIIVKDLSRFGRDYIEAGKYLQKIFPEKGVRFISVNDNYDSEDADVNDMHLILPIRNFINDSYARDISTKVKSSQSMKRKKGEFIGAFAPFGYKKSSDDKHKLVIDTDISHIVERIFNMKVEGYSSKAIADFLNSIGMVTPSKHKENLGTNFATGFAIKNSKWDAKMINRIITNRVYIGDLEQGKRIKLNYKSKQIIKVKKEDWTTIRNSHQGIIDASTFKLANKMLIRDMKLSKNEPYILSGMLYCKDCNCPMIRRKVKSKNGYTIFYICSSYNKSSNCTRHSVKEEFILTASKFALDEHLKQYNDLIKKAGSLDTSSLSFDVDFTHLTAEKKKYETLRQSLFMDLEDELITTEEFERYRKNYLIKIREIEKQIITKENTVKELESRLKNKDKFLADMLPSGDIEKLNRLSLVSFVDKIQVSENSKLNFVFNNLDTINLLQELTKVESSENNKKQLVLPVAKVYAEKIDKPILKEAMGGAL